MYYTFPHGKPGKHCGRPSFGALRIEFTEHGSPGQHSGEPSFGAVIAAITASSLGKHGSPGKHIGPGPPLSALSLVTTHGIPGIHMGAPSFDTSRIEFVEHGSPGQHSGPGPSFGALTSGCWAKLKTVKTEASTSMQILCFMIGISSSDESGNYCLTHGLSIQ